MKNLTIIGLRLIAIWLLLTFLGFIQFLPMYFIGQSEDLYSTGIGMLIVVIIYIVAAALLFFKAPALAVKMSGDFEEPSIRINNYEKLTAILFASIGVLIFFNALESFIGSVGSVYNDRVANPQSTHQFIRTIRILLFGGGIQMLVGVCLFIGGKKIANWWYNFRNWT